MGSSIVGTAVLPMTRTGKPLPGALPVRSWVTFALVTVGLGLNLRASVLLGPHLHERFDVPPVWHYLLIAMPLLLGGLVRLPVGVLTDRYGVRVMFPAVSLLGAVSATGLALAGSVPLAIFFGVAAGVASSAFVVGASFVARASPYGWRGRTLGVFSGGVGIAAVLSAVAWCIDSGGRASALLLAGALTLFAVLAGRTLRDPVPPWRAGSLIRTCTTMIRLAASSSVSLLYMLALSGIGSIAVFLPVYLDRSLGFAWSNALATTGAVVVVATVARLVGGWRTDRRPTARLLIFCYGIAATLCVVLAMAPHSWVAVPAITGIAVCDGLASGALLALIGKAVRPGSAGAVLGVTGAAGAVGALLPPLIFGGLHRLTPSYSSSWALLAALLVAAALYVRSHSLSIGLGLAVEFEPEPSPTALSVAQLAEPETRLGAAAVVSRLAELATSDELVVVYGLGERPRAGLSPEALAGGLRDRLPRHCVAVVRIAERPESLSRDALLITEHIDAGTLTIAVVPAASLQEVANDLSIYLQADRTLKVSYDPAQGPALHPVRG
jgi:NNP family nitrate/nitrite transporter-like MFS transporter